MKDNWFMYTQEIFSSYYKNGQPRAREKNGFWVEDSNHLGNVLEVISDRKLQVDGETIISYKEDFGGSTTGDFTAGAGTTLSNESDALKIENTSSSLTTELILPTAIGEEYTLDLNLLERNGIGVFVEISQTTGSITEELAVGSNIVTIVGTADDRITGFTLIGVPDPLTPTVVIDDVKLSKVVGDDGIVDYHVADVVTQSDYYPFGMLLPNRNQVEDNDYRYGFQNQEVDPEIKGDNNSVNYKYRIHDPRVGRFFAEDPLAPQYPHNSPYAFSENVVISHVELEGREKDFYMDAVDNAFQNSKTRTYGTKQASASEIIHLTLDVMGLFPVLGAVPDLANGIFYSIEGDHASSFYSYAAIIPIIGQGSTIVKWSVKATSKYKYVTKGYKIAGKYTDDFLKSADKVIQGIGGKKFISTPISKLTGEGSDKLQLINKKFNNNIDHLSDSDISAAIKELHGTKIVDGAGKAFDHVTEVRQAMQGIDNARRGLEKGFKNGTFTGEVLDQAKDLYKHLGEEGNRLKNVLEGAEKSAQM